MEQETKLCNNCKRSINVGTFDLHESHCVRHIQLCSLCDEPIPIKDMQEHYNEYHAPRPCEMCGRSIPPDELEEHLEQSCAEVKVECKFCELDIRRADYHEHAEQCGSRTDFCELCNQRVMLKEMSEHKEMKCGHMKAESPLQRYQLEGMGLVGHGSGGGESDSSDDFNATYHPPQLAAHSATPPPSYEHRHDDSMHVDPYWLQTVAEACGEDNLDALLAQNVFFENMRSVRSSRHRVTNDAEPVMSHDSHVTSEVSSDEEDTVVRAKPLHNLERQSDICSHDQDFARQLAATDEQDDFYLAQRMQEREVMGHSKTLYEEERVREIAREIEEDKEAEEGERRVVAGTVDEEIEVQKEMRKMFDEEIAAKKKKIEELAEERRLMAEQMKEAKEEIESLQLASQLRKEDIAEGHKALWMKTAQSSQLADEKLAQRLQIKEDRFQYGRAHLEEEEPCPKTSPTHSYSDDSVKIPCQWCEELIPFEQVMLHQQSCYNNLFGGGMDGGRGLHLTDDTFRRVERDDHSWQMEHFTVECQYCHATVSASNLTSHEALCEYNPDSGLKRVYETRYPPSTTSTGLALGQEKHSALREGPPSLSMYHADSAQPSPSNFTTSEASTTSSGLPHEEKGPCEFCHKVIPLVHLVRHEAICQYTQHNPRLDTPTFSHYSPAPPTSSPTLLEETSPVGTLAGGGAKRTLAIRFPAMDSDTETRQGVERDGLKRGQPVHPVKPISQAGSTSCGGDSHSSTGKGHLEEWKAPKKRHNLSETFEPWSDMKEPVKKAARNEASFVPHVTSALTRSVSGSRSKPVYQSSSINERKVYGASSVERRKNVLSSAAKVSHRLSTKQTSDEKLETDASIESVGNGIKQLHLHSRSKRLTSGSASSKPSLPSRSTAPSTKPLQKGNPQLQVAQTKINGASSILHSNTAGQSTRSRSGTAGVKDVSRTSKHHSSSSKTPSSKKSRSVPSKSPALGATSNGPTRPSLASSSAGQGRVGQSSRPSVSGGATRTVSGRKETET